MHFTPSTIVAVVIVALCCTVALALGGCSNEQSSQADTISTFAIEGKWKNVGDGTFGQAQAGSIVTFDGTNCNFFSPQDTYAFYEDGDGYTLDCTSMLTSKNLTFDVEVVDNDNIRISYGSTVVELKRVG